MAKRRFRPRELQKDSNLEDVRRQLNQMGVELDRDLEQALTGPKMLELVTASSYAPAFNEVVRLAPPTDGARLILPSPNLEQLGARVLAVLETDTGALSAEAVGGTVNGEDTVEFTAAVGFVEFVLTPTGWFTTPASATADTSSLEELIDALTARIEELESKMSDSGILIQIGETFSSDGADVNARGNKEGAIVVQPLGAQYGEASARDRVFHASTGAAGVAPGTALGTAPPIVIYNPVGSNTVLEILSTTLGYVSGTLGAGSIVYAGPGAAQPAAPSGGTALTTRSGKLGSNLASSALAFQGSTIAATASILRPVYALGASLATTAYAPVLLKDVVDGEFVVDEGGFFALQGITAAGSSPLVLLGVSWRERQKA